MIRIVNGERFNTAEAALIGRYAFMDDVDGATSAAIYMTEEGLFFVHYSAAKAKLDTDTIARIGSEADFLKLVVTLDNFEPLADGWAERFPAASLAGSRGRELMRAEAA